MGTCLRTLANDQSQQNQQQLIIQERPDLVAVPNAAPSRPDIFHLDPKTVSDVPYKGQLIDINIFDVHDGDTVHGIILLGNMPFRLAVRLLGIDTPEITAGKDRLPEEKLAAQKARDYLKSILIPGTKVRIEDNDKYSGRVLGHLVLPDGSVASELMIKNGYAREYHGEKKQAWTYEELTSAPFV